MSAQHKARTDGDDVELRLALEASRKAMNKRGIDEMELAIMESMKTTSGSGVRACSFVC